jgi:lysophospholipase L1-like esterase
MNSRLSGFFLLAFSLFSILSNGGCTEGNSGDALQAGAQTASGAGWSGLGGASAAAGASGTKAEVTAGGFFDRGGSTNTSGSAGDAASGLGGISATAFGGSGASGGTAITEGHGASGVENTAGSSAQAGSRANTYPVSAGKPTIYLAGDSTVQTYSEAQAPQQGWGQRLPEFFTADVVIVNKAIGGRSSKSYVDEGRLDEIVKSLKVGDYLFAQWGINDRYKSDQTRYTDPATTFRTYLKKYIDGARGKNAIPVLITPTPRLDYSNGEFKNDFPDYCTAIKEVGAQTNKTVIDLQTKGLEYYTSIGYDQVQSKIALDVLHFKTEGAYQMARLVAEGVKESDLPISPYVK